MMIKKILLFYILITISVVYTTSAQQYTDFQRNSLQIAYINSVEILELIPEKTAAVNLINDLNQKYKDELVLMQNDYNNKYTDFLANQNNLAESIKLRRMQELYELEQSINRFMKIAQEDVESQEKQLIVPLKQKLSEAVNQVGIEQGFVCIYDMANTSIAFLTPNAIDATPFVKEKLQIKKIKYSDIP